MIYIYIYLWCVRSWKYEVCSTAASILCSDVLGIPVFFESDESFCECRGT